MFRDRVISYSLLKQSDPHLWIHSKCQIYIFYSLSFSKFQICLLNCIVNITSWMFWIHFKFVLASASHTLKSLQIQHVPKWTQSIPSPNWSTSSDHFSGKGTTIYLLTINPETPYHFLLPYHFPRQAHSPTHHPSLSPINSIHQISHNISFHLHSPSSSSNPLSCVSHGLYLRIIFLRPLVNAKNQG